MATKHLHILGIDPGGTTGWSKLTVPRMSIFGTDNPDILDWDYGELVGPEPGQAQTIARMAREIQSLDYMTGPAIIVEAWGIDPEFKSTDPDTLSPVRVGAMLSLLQAMDRIGDATLHFQSRALAKQTVTDERLKAWGMYHKGSTHIRDATRHAITGLRRAAGRRAFALALWPYPPNGTA